MKDVSSDKFASVIARILDDKQGKDIKILNIANISVLADYFVICSFLPFCSISSNPQYPPPLSSSSSSGILDSQFSPHQAGMKGTVSQQALQDTL